MKLDFIKNADISGQQLAGLAQLRGIDADAEQYNKAVPRRFVTYSCFADGVLIGFVQAVSNGVTHAYVQDLVVHPRWQRQGIGTELVDCLCEELEELGIHEIKAVYTEDVKEFFHRNGFRAGLSGSVRL